MRINSNNTNPGRACVKHNHARIMKSSKTQKINNYRSTPVLLAPQLKQFATGSSKMITRQKAEDERAKEIVMETQKTEALKIEGLQTRLERK